MRLENLESEHQARAEDLLSGRNGGWLDVEEILPDEDLALLHVELGTILKRRTRQSRRTSGLRAAAPPRHIARAA